jgi:hypothetical protein
VAADIRLATPERLPRLAAMLGRAFAVEPAMLWSYGTHGDVAARFSRFFEILEERFVESGMLWEAGDALGRRDGSRPMASMVSITLWCGHLMSLRATQRNARRSGLGWTR